MIFRRTTMIIAATAALAVAGSTVASAHHCYKEQWRDAAYAALAPGGTPWISLSDLGTMFLIPTELQAECGYVADDAVEDWMADEGIEQEPLIHSKAIVGGGAYHRAGKEPNPFSYLSESDFESLTEAVLAGLEECETD